MTALAIARVALTRLFRERSTLFFVFVFPLALVLLIGLQFGGGRELTVVAVGADGPVAAELAAGLEGESDVTVQTAPDRAAAIDEVARGEADAAAVFPVGFEDDVAAGDARVELLTAPDGRGLELRPLLSERISAHSRELVSADVAAEVTGRPVAELRDAAATAAGLVPEVRVRRTSVAGDPVAAEFADANPFASGASSQLVLFVFITSLTGASALVQERNLGMITRVLATPTRVREVLLGAAAGRFGIALFQGAYIMLGATVLFGVGWGDPPGAIAVLVVFSAVSAGAAMLVGASVDNDAQAGGIGIGLGLGLAALGGSMAPLEVFPDTMRVVAHVSPHAWANDAFADLIRRDGTVLTIVPELAVLAVLAAVLLGVGARQLRRSVLGGA